MQLKRYREATVADALNRARAELGPDALVLATRLVRAHGVRGWMGSQEVEVSVAIERDVSENRPPCPAPRHSAREDGAMAQLQASGVDPAWARQVAETLPRTARRGASLASLRRALAQSVAPITARDEGYAPVEVFVGPPGAGKTTTIAKIAAQERARRGRRMTLLSADAYRVGAIEQLRMYADIIGSPFVAVRCASELEGTLVSARASMLVDTAGRSPHDDACRELFAAFARRKDIRTHLVMPAATTAAEGARLIDRYRDAQPKRVVLTRVDEAETVSPLMNVLRERHLPVSYLGTGQRVPEDLFRATSPLVAACMLGESVTSLEALR